MPASKVKTLSTILLNASKNSIPSKAKTVTPVAGIYAAKSKSVPVPDADADANGDDAVSSFVGDKSQSTIFRTASKNSIPSKAKTVAPVAGIDAAKAKSVPVPDADTNDDDAVSSFVDDKTLTHFFSIFGASSTESSSSSSLSSSSKVSRTKKPPTSILAADLAIANLSSDNSSVSKNPTKKLAREIENILRVDSYSQDDNSSDSVAKEDEKQLDNIFDLTLLTSPSHKIVLERRKEVSRQRKQKWVHKNTQTGRFEKLVQMCGHQLGAEVTIKVFDRLRRASGVKEYNSLIKFCIEMARKSEDEDVLLDQIHIAYQLLTSMKEQGFKIADATYGPILMYLSEMGMVEEFEFFVQVIKDGNSESLSSLGYYEMLLYIRVNNQDKIQELCNRTMAEEGGGLSSLAENYLLALSESGQKETFLQLLERIDIMKFSSFDHATCIFKSLGKFSLESLAEKYILALKSSDYGAENVSHLIVSYAIGMPNLAVEDVLLKVKDMHAKADVAPSAGCYEKLVLYCCDLLKVHEALDVVDLMLQDGLTLSTETLHSILDASGECQEFNVVRRIYEMIHHHNLKPNSETFRRMISLSMRMKDFHGAYSMLKCLEEINLKPTAGMYNSIMGGYFREKNRYGALRVLRQMELANVKPDSQTFSYLITNSEHEEDILKYYEEMKHAGVVETKYVLMALINAYANCGQYEKAKQVVVGGVPDKNLIELKGVLVSALASHGQLTDALRTYDEIRNDGFKLDNKAIVSLIEHIQSEGELSRLLQLLGELSDPDYWFDGCCRIISYCVRHKHLSSAIDLLKQQKDELSCDELAMESLFDEAYSLVAELGSSHLQFGMDLLKAVKKELKVRPSRRSLDFLLCACVNAKDLQNALLVWNEYQEAGFPYNVMSYLWMYQALLASGDFKSARVMLPNIPKDDPHVCSIIEACQETFITTDSPSKKKKKKKNKKVSSEMQ